MDVIAKHPMENFPVRPLEFAVDKVAPRDFVWSRTCPEFSVFINAIGLHIPHFERYLVRTMIKIKPLIKDDKLLRDVSAIIGQESHHAKNLLHFNKVMASRYPHVAVLDAEQRDCFAERAKSDPIKLMVGFTAGYETFTFLAGMIILDNYFKWLADSEPVMKALWVWHQVEEVEHGAVAFDVYKHLYGSHEYYRKWMIVLALTHIAAETIKAYMHMVKVEGWLRNPFRAISSMAFCGSMLLRLLWSALPVFRRGYDPRKHPLVNNRQNAIQIAWRRYEKQGGNVLEIDHQKMAQILGMEAPSEHGMPA